ncbi:MAG: metallophosphoesterase family protein [Bryobacteraceae bacterium]
MQYLILSDIHGNLEALEAVLQDARGSYKQVLNCGDLVGYGPNPNEVADWCRSHVTHVVRGNHDKACCGLMEMEWFNDNARFSAEWTLGVLSEENLSYLRALPEGPVAVENFQLVHGSPRDEDEYLINVPEVAEQTLEAAVTFFGHTHIQGGFFVHRNGIHRLIHSQLTIEDTAAYLINPGSVGQPRDNDPRAAYVLFDTETMNVEYRRVEYPVKETWRKIVEAGLPDVLGRRLTVGV